MKRSLLYILLVGLILNTTHLASQKDDRDVSLFDQYSFLDYFITEEGDTIPLVDLPEILVAGRTLSSMDKARYRRIKYHTQKVYPYAYNALILLAEVDSAKAQMKRKRHQKKYVKKIEKKLKDQFKEDIKNLTVTQGKILIKLIEKESQRPFYGILKELKSGATAFIFQALGKKYGYDLKKGYDEEEEWMIERALRELDAEGKLKTEIPEKT